MLIIQGDIVEVIADEGMILVNKQDPTTIAHHLWLSILDDPSNWNEIPEDEVNVDGKIR